MDLRQKNSSDSSGGGGMMSTADLFEFETRLPDDHVRDLGNKLIGFKARYERLRDDLRLMVDSVGVAAWSQQFYQQTLPVCDTLKDRYPLVIFHGDVGTGKTATAEAVTDALVREMGAPHARLFKLSTRVRGGTGVGVTSFFLNKAFTALMREAGNDKYSFLVLDEADSLAATRNTLWSHHEDKVGVNTLIQKIDDLRRFEGRIMVILCTNRIQVIDPAIMRRALRIEYFERPNDAERRELLEKELAGIGLSEEHMKELVALTGPDESRKRIGLTFSDLRTRLLPEAIALAFPDRKITGDDLIQVAKQIQPTPTMIASRPQEQ